MRRINAPYVVSVLIGTLLGVGLFFILAPRLKPPPMNTPPIVDVPAEKPDATVPGRPAAPQTEAVHPDPRRVVVLNTKPAAVLNTKPAPQTQQRASGPGQQERGTLPVRPADPIRPPGPPATAAKERAPGAAVQLPSAHARPDPGIAQAPVSSADVQGPLYILHVGPVADRDRAAEIVRQLALAGFDARVISREEPGSPHFQVVSETVPLAVAERRVVALSQLGLRPQLRAVAGGFAQLRFGAFASRAEADLLAERVRISGYAFAAVVREGGTVYVITLGPYGQDALETILLRTRFRWMLPVTVSPAN